MDALMTLVSFCFLLGVVAIGAAVAVHLLVAFAALIYALVALVGRAARWAWRAVIESTPDTEVKHGT